MQSSATNTSAAQSLRDRIAEHRADPGRTKRYPLSIKREAVRLLDSGASAEELADELGIQASLLYRWRRKRRGRPTAAPQTTPPPSSPMPPPRVLTVEPAKPDGALLKVEVGGYIVTVARATP